MAWYDTHPSGGRFGALTRLSSPAGREAVKREVMYQLEETAEVVGTAAAFGALEEHYGADKMRLLKSKDASGVEDPTSGVPVSVVTGVGLHLAAFAMMASDYEGSHKITPHLHNVANGALAAYGVKLGADLARDHWTKSQGEASYQVSAPYQPAYFGHEREPAVSSRGFSSAEAEAWETARTGR